MKLYDQAGAPNPRRVRIFMAEKGISCETQQINIVKGENLSAEFLEVSPRGLLPVLVLDDGTVLEESMAICLYLEHLHPEPSLMGTGKSAVERATIAARQRQIEFDGLLSAAETFRNSYPGFASRGLGGNVGEVSAIPELVVRGTASLLRFYEWFDESLSDSRFACGDSFTIADITALCAVDFGSTAARVPVPDERENLKRWHAEVSARPSAQA